MSTLSQINLGANPATLLGIIYLLFAPAYLIVTIILLSQRGRRLTSLALTLYIIQMIFVPLFMLLSGLILFFQGWRLDPVLQFGQFLSSLLIIYLSVKDIVINAVYNNR
jgi:hypothetical protein